MTTDKTLEQLENDSWGAPRSGYSVEIRAHAVRKKPISKLSTSDLAFMIRQDLGVPHILERAISILENLPLTEDDEDEISLFEWLLKLPETFWRDHPKWHERILILTKSVITTRTAEWREEAKLASEQYGGIMTPEAQLETDINRDLYLACQAFIEKYGIEEDS
jgi:hypothetical protein